MKENEAYIGKEIDGIRYGLFIEDIFSSGKRTINGLSGSSLIHINTDGMFSFELSDAQNSSYTIVCNLETNGTLRILANTVMLERNVRIRHPDLFAGKLITYIIKQMQTVDPLMPLRIQSQWHAPMNFFSSFNFPTIIEDNYEAYMLARQKKYSPKYAAMLTWSGQLFQKLGYTVLDNSDVSELTSIYVTFRKSSQ